MYQDTTILLPKTTPLVRPDINVPRYNNTTTKDNPSCQVRYQCTKIQQYYYQRQPLLSGQISMYQDTTILLPKTTPLVRPDINVPRYNNTTTKDNPSCQVRYQCTKIQQYYYQRQPLLSGQISMYQDTTILLPKTTPLVRSDINVPRYNNTTTKDNPSCQVRYQCTKIQQYYYQRQPLLSGQISMYQDTTILLNCSPQKMPPLL